MHTFLVRRLMAGVLAVGLTAACRSPVEAEGTVTASIEGQAVRIENHTAQRVHYRVVEAGTAARIGWLPCEQLDACPSIPAKSAVLVPLAEVYGWDDSAELVQVNWWRMVPQLGRPEYRMVGIDVVAGGR